MFYRVCPECGSSWLDDNGGDYWLCRECDWSGGEDDLDVVEKDFDADYDDLDES